MLLEGFSALLDGRQQAGKAFKSKFKQVRLHAL
jgi:hypothetical protein